MTEIKKENRQKKPFSRSMRSKVLRRANKRKSKLRSDPAMEEFFGLEKLIEIHQKLEAKIKERKKINKGSNIEG